MTLIKEIKSGDGDNNIVEGDYVIHHEFGKGKVEKLIGSGDNQKAIVKFEIEGQKKLMLKYAKLKKVEDKEKSVPAESAENPQPEAKSGENN